MAIAGGLAKHLTTPTLQHLYIWLTSEKTHERQRAVHRCTALFKFLNHKQCLSVSTTSPAPHLPASTHSIDQAGLKLRGLPGSAFRVLGLQTPPPPGCLFKYLNGVVLLCNLGCWPGAHCAPPASAS